MRNCGLLVDRKLRRVGEPVAAPTGRVVQISNWMTVYTGGCFSGVIGIFW